MTRPSQRITHSAISRCDAACAAADTRQKVRIARTIVAPGGKPLKTISEYITGAVPRRSSTIGSPAPELVQVAPRCFVGRLDPQCGLELRNGATRIAHPRQDDSQIVPQAGIAGLECD